MPTDWSKDEVELIVADYFAMLRRELAGETVNKAEHNRALRRHLNNRSKGSVEFKHQNISAVLLRFDDLPYIEGYKPRSNYQGLLEEAVIEFLEGEPELIAGLAASRVVRAAEPAPIGTVNPLDVLEEPPESREWAQTRAADSGAPVARKIDFVRLDAENRQLGRRGEEWALEFERRRLHDIEQRPDLSKAVVWVADVEGDGAGYDIRSFNADASPRFIEVKTTGLGKYFPFAVTANELRVSEREATRYHLYRVFSFTTTRRLYTLQGALSQTCQLAPAVYRARAGG